MPNQVFRTDRVEALRRMLVARRQEVQKEIDDLLAERRLSQSEQREQSVADVGDLAVQDLTADQQLALLEVRHQKRQQLDDALQRLEAGTYGICEDCGKPIGKERLEVLPFARRCISCQEQAEALERIEREPERQE